MFRCIHHDCGSIPYLIYRIRYSVVIDFIFGFHKLVIKHIMGNIMCSTTIGRIFKAVFININKKWS